MVSTQSRKRDEPALAGATGEVTAADEQAAAVERRPVECMDLPRAGARREEAEYNYWVGSFETSVAHGYLAFSA